MSSIILINISLTAASLTFVQLQCINARNGLPSNYVFSRYKTIWQNTTGSLKLACALSIEFCEFNFNQKQDSNLTQYYNVWPNKNI